MKTTTSKAANKLVTRFDKELKALLLNELKAIRSVKEQMMNIQAGNLNAA